MRTADRSRVPEPKSLAASNEIEAARAHFATSPNSAFSFAAYKSDDVKKSLRALFLGKCAYCESFFEETAPVDVEHYRPKAAVEGRPKHPGYWWLAMKWENLLPSCIDCNRRRRQISPVPGDSLEQLLSGAQRGVPKISGKKDCFPVAGVYAELETASLTLEDPYLLNPTVDDPRLHLSWLIQEDMPIALVLPKAARRANAAPGDLAAAAPGQGGIDAVAADAAARELSKKGAVSIQVYGLNRLGLLQSRTRVLRRLFFLLDLVVELQALVDDADVPPKAATKLNLLSDRVVEEMKAMAAPDQPYSELVHAFLERFRKQLVA